MNIVLIGYRCCGKTSAGRRVAEKLNRKFIDTDDLIIKKAGCSIDEIVSRYGWRHFRNMEKDVVREISSNDNLVIATGGGVVTENENIVNLKKNGFIVWLYADIDTIKERMKKDDLSRDTRPSLTGDDPTDEIESVVETRKKLYESTGDMAIDTSNLTICEITRLIIHELDRMK